MSGFLRVLANMANEIEALRSDQVEHHLILDDVVKDLRALTDGRTSSLAAEWLQRQQPEANRPNGKATPALRYWNTIPAGWFIQDPTGTWWEVLETTADGQYQRVKLRNPKGQVGEWPRRGLDTVRAVPGTAGGPIQGATDALFSRFDVTVLEDQA